MAPKLYWLTNSPSGRLAISARPRGGDWLEDEVEGWRKEGVDVVVSLLTESENEELDLTREATVVREKGIRFSSFPQRKSTNWSNNSVRKFSRARAS